MQSNDDTKCWEDVGQQEPQSVLVGTHSVAATGEDSVAISNKLDALTPHTPAVVLLGICSNEVKTHIHTKACTQMFIVTLFLIMETWKKPSALQQMMEKRPDPSRRWSVIQR